MADDVSAGDEALRLDPDTTRHPSGPRRRALWGALAVVAVVAGAIAVGWSSGDDEPTALPISLGASTFEASGAAADSVLAWIRYEAGAGLPALGGEATAHRLRAQVDQASVGRLAEALGLAADLEQDGGTWRVVDEAGTLEVDVASGSWWFSAHATSGGDSSSGGGSSGSAPGCGTGPGGTCTTTAPPPAPDTPVSDGDATTSGEVTCAAIGCPEPDRSEAGCEATTIPGDGRCADPMPLPEPVAPTGAADLPEELDARQIALDVLAAGGMPVDGASVQVDGPFETWFVVVEPVVDGTPIGGWTGTVAVGSGGSVVSAGGTMAHTEALGAYPLVDTAAAIDRLNAGMGDGGGVGVPEPATDPSASVAASAPVTEPCPPDDPVACPYAGVDAPPPLPCDGGPEADAVECSATTACAAAPGTDPGGCIDPAVPTTLASDLPLGPVDEPAPLVVTLTGAERILLAVPANDGTANTYLVPGYRLTGDDGAVVEVVALPDDLVAGPEPAEPAGPDTTVEEDPPATEPGVVEPAGPEPVDCQVLVEDDGSGTTHTIQTCPGQTPQTSQPTPTPEHPTDLDGDGI